MRLIFYAGKGGVGKTSICAATGLWLAERGLRTLVMSLDAAHSLADVFDLPVSLLDRGRGRPVPVAERLWIQELDVQEELEHHWQAIYAYLTTLIRTTGLDSVVADELAIIPGMEEISALLHINKYARDEAYDVVLLDCAPTGESLRFVSLPTALEWYMRKVFRLERNLATVVRPVLKRLTDLPLPEDEYFANIAALFDRLDGIQALLADPAKTTVRLVTNPEKIVIKETQRAFMYFNLYGMTVDAVVVNRVIPDSEQSGLLGKWRLLQRGYMEEIHAVFAPTPIWPAPWFEGEVVGREGLRALACALHNSGADPLRSWRTTPAHRFVREGGQTRVDVQLPFARAADVELHRIGDELVLRIGGFKQHILMPRSFAGLRPAGVRLENGTLSIQLAPVQDPGAK